MRKILSMFALSALMFPVLAHAATPKTVKGQIAQEIRAANPGLSFRATSIKTIYLNGAVGGFSLAAFTKGPKGLRGTDYNVSGQFNAKNGPATISGLTVTPAKFQPRVTP